jgi:DNA (cytosine-5)-methyltransferase 1
MRVGSLFTGVGGLDLGLEKAGHEIAWQVEYDEKCQSILRRHWPSVDLHKDVCNAGRNVLKPVDLICGGFPCQDLSVAGYREGLSGARSALWWEFHRIIGELTPRWVLIENVPGLLLSNEGEDLATLLHSMEELRYGWSYRVLDSRNFVPQRRKRVFIVGYLGDRCPPEVLLESEGLSGNTEASREARARVTSDTRDSFEESDRIITHQSIFPTIGASSAGTSRPGGQGAERHMYIGDPPRRITPREAERLQGFDDDWTRWSDSGEELADGPRYKMMGNAVTVDVAEWLGRQLSIADKRSQCDSR